MWKRIWSLQLKKYVSMAVVITFLLANLTACGPSKEQLKAEQSFYDLQKAIAEAKKEQPIFRIVPIKDDEPIVLTNVKALEVFAPALSGSEAAVQYRHIDYAAPWANVVLSGLGIAGYVGQSVGLAHEMSKFATGVYYNMYGQGSQVKIQGGSVANVNQSGGSLGNIGATDATSTPTVVTQPTPIVVNQPEPVIVNPVVVGQ